MWRVPLRGGNWNNGSNAGLAALNLNNDRSNSNTNIGFRPALQLRRIGGLKGQPESTIEKELHSSPRGNNLSSRAASTSTARTVAWEFYIMPKTHNNIWETIISWDNLYAAYLEARKGKRYKNQVLSFSEHLEENLITIQNELIWKEWQPVDFRSFMVREPKPRQINAPVFRDRVVHHALVRVIEPLFDRKFIHRSCACRPHRGTYFAIKETEKMVSNPRNKYVLKADVSGYFPSVDHDVLKKIMRRTISDRNALWLIDAIIDGGGDGDKGIPIGSLTSQLFANIYLDDLDHFITDEMGYGRYIRYMDDFLLFHDNKEELKKTRDVIEEYLLKKLKLQLNHRTQVKPLSQGVDFCGYRTFRTHVLPRKRNVKRAKNRLKKLAEKVNSGEENIEILKPPLMSFLGYMKHCKGHKTTKSVLDTIIIGGERW